MTEKERQSMLDAGGAAFEAIIESGKPAYRFVYAEWLEEYGCAEEAERQRELVAPFLWFEDFVERATVAEDSSYEYEDRACLSARIRETLMEIGREIASQRGEKTIVGHVGDLERMQDMLNEEREQFLEYLSETTGIEFPEDTKEDVYFSCSC